MTLWVIFGALLALALTGGFGAARAGYGRAVAVLTGLLVVALAVLVVVAEEMRSGWDGLGLAIATVVGLGPLVIGLGIGGLAGWIARRRSGE